jgi:hypothetical protein
MQSAASTKPSPDPKAEHEENDATNPSKVAECIGKTQHTSTNHGLQIIQLSLNHLMIKSLYPSAHQSCLQSISQSIKPLCEDLQYSNIFHWHVFLYWYVNQVIIFCWSHGKLIHMDDTYAYALSVTCISLSTAASHRDAMVHDVSPAHTKSNEHNIAHTYSEAGVKVMLHQ